MPPSSPEWLPQRSASAARPSGTRWRRCATKASSASPAIDPGARGETLAIADFVRLANALAAESACLTMPMPAADGIRVHRNPRVAPATEPYGTARSRILSHAGFAAADAEIRRWPGYAETPLRRLPGLAARLGVADLHLQGRGRPLRPQELQGAGRRLCGVPVAGACGRRRAAPAAQGVDSRDLIAGRWRSITRTLTVTCATDGNHGRSVAWGAQLFGCRCVIYVHESVSEARCAAIAHYGADVVRVPGNYDDAVRHAADEARKNGWTVVSDTTYEGYREIPIDVMHGYGVMSHEIVRTMADAPPTHVLVQAGVGALAASVCAAFWLAWGARRPRLVIVEPIEADCHFQSALAGRPVAVTGAPRHGDGGTRVR